MADKDSNDNGNTPRSNNSSTKWIVILVLGLCTLIVLGFGIAAFAPRYVDPTPAPAAATVSVPDTQVSAPAGGTVVIVNGNDNCVPTNGSTANCQKDAPVVAPVIAAPVVKEFDPSGCPLTDAHGGTRNDEASKANGQCSYNDAGPAAPSAEFKCEHANPGEYLLPAGYSANAGHLKVWNGNGWTDHLYVDDKVVVLTNESPDPIKIFSTDGAGICNSVDFHQVVAMRFSEGCDTDGCSAYMWVRIGGTNPGVTTQTKTQYCAQDANKADPICAK